MDDISVFVDRAMGHRLIRRPNGEFYRVNGWLRCETCGTDVYAKNRPATVSADGELEIRHRIYVAVTEVMTAVISDSAGRIQRANAATELFNSLGLVQRGSALVWADSVMAALKKFYIDMEVASG